MSRVESPFHAIAAQAQDDPPADLNVTLPVSPPSPAVSPTSSAAAAAAAAPAVTTNGESLPSRQASPAAADSRSEELGKNCAAEEDADNGGSVQERNASSGASPAGGVADPSPSDVVVKRSSKKRTNVWTKTTSRKSAKKSSGKNSGLRRASDAKDDTVILKQWHMEDDANYPIFLSIYNKAEKIELSDDRLGASGSKGYRMVRATRGVSEGAWYFEVTVVRLGRSGHARLGWSTGKGDIQAPVGYDAHSYSFRDIDGSKVHAALREAYADAYHENDVIGFYVNLPRDENVSRKADEEVVGYKGQSFVVVSDEPLKPLPGSEILFFKNGVNQGVAFRNIFDGVYYPAASMYTLPGDEFCKVLFNFGSDFKYSATDIGNRPLPNPMSMAPPPKKIETHADTPGPTEMVAESVDDQGKRQIVSESARVEHESVGAPADGKIAPKHIEKGPPTKKKKVKVSKPSLKVDLPAPAKKKPKSGEPRPKSELKPGTNHKMSKSANEAVKFAAVSHPKQSKKTGSGAEVPRMRAIQTVNKKDGLHFSVPASQSLGTGSALQPVKKTKKVLQGGVLVVKGKKMDKLERGNLPMNGTDLGSLKRKKTESSKRPMKSVSGGKESLTNGGLRNFQGTRRPMSNDELHKTKPSQKSVGGVGILKRNVKDLQQLPAVSRGPFFPPHPGFRPHPKAVRPAGSMRIPERNSVTSLFPPSLGMWDAMNVAVDVVETPSNRPVKFSTFKS